MTTQHIHYCVQHTMILCHRKTQNYCLTFKRDICSSKRHNVFINIYQKFFCNDGALAAACIICKLYSYNFMHSKKIYEKLNLLSIILRPNLCNCILRFVAYQAVSPQHSCTETSNLYFEVMQSIFKFSTQRFIAKHL